MVRLFLLGLVLLLSQCGKNDGIRSVPNSPYQPGPYQPPISQAPMPPSGGYYPPTSFYPAPYSSGYNGGYGGYGNNGTGQYYQPYFVPQMPQGSPSQYTPFLPIDNYMQRNNELQRYWQQYWQNWLQYAQSRQYNSYDFPAFWFEYCPEQWDNTEFAPLYNYFDANAYSWVEPQTQIAIDIEPAYFWEYYEGMPYDYLDGLNLCYDECGYW